MAKPPESPPPSDIEGVDRDAHKSRARGKPAVPRQQEQLKRADEDTAARPDYEADVAGEPNAR